MLYTTTRSNRDAYTAQRVLCENRGPDGGFYAPFRLPVFSKPEIDAMMEHGFGHCVAEVLNCLFNTRLSGADVDLSIGKTSVRTVNITNRIVAVQCWHNPEGQFAQTVSALAGLVRQDGSSNVSDWMQIAARIAVLFGVFSDLRQNGFLSEDGKLDISVVAGDFTDPMAVWYARNMGLPVGNLVCCCNENSKLWDLFSRGQLRTDSVALASAIPKADISVPFGLERLLQGCCGHGTASAFAAAVTRGATFYLEEREWQRLKNGIHVSVNGTQRVLSAIPTAYSTYGYLLSPVTALSFTGLQDYRSRSGTHRKALILEEIQGVFERNAPKDSFAVRDQNIV